MRSPPERKSNGYEKLLPKAEGAAAFRLLNAVQEIESALAAEISQDFPKSLSCHPGIP